MADEHGDLRAAFEVTFEADERLALPKHAALVALCRLLSDQIDASGSEATNRLTAAYLSALKDIKAVTSETAPRSPKKEGASSGDSNGSALGALRGIKGGKAG